MEKIGDAFFARLMIAVTNWEVYNTVFIRTKHNSQFAFYTSGYWEDAETTKTLKDLIEEENSNQFQLHEEKDMKGKLQLKVGLTAYQLSVLEDI